MSLQQILSNADSPEKQAELLEEILELIKSSWDLEEEALEEVMYVVGKVFPSCRSNG